LDRAFGSGNAEAVCEERRSAKRSDLAQGQQYFFWYVVLGFAYCLTLRKPFDGRNEFGVGVGIETIDLRETKEVLRCGLVF
jgi:hypothetical protein